MLMIPRVRGKLRSLACRTKPKSASSIVANLDARFCFIFLLPALSPIRLRKFSLCFFSRKSLILIHHASNLNLFVAVFFLIPQLLLFSLQNSTTLFFQDYFLNSLIFQNPKLQIICIIFEKSGSFYGLAAILNFSTIFNFRERTQNNFFF
jgi:hypothetical protein